MAPSPLSSVRAQELPSSWPPTALGTGHGGPDPIPAGPAAAPPDTSGRRAPLPRPRSSRSQRRNPNRAAVPHHPGGLQAPWAPAPAPGLGGTLSPRGEVPQERPAARGRQEAHVPVLGCGGHEPLGQDAGHTQGGPRQDLGTLCGRVTLQRGGRAGVSLGARDWDPRATLRKQPRTRTRAMWTPPKVPGGQEGDHPRPRGTESREPPTGFTRGRLRPRKKRELNSRG